MEYLVIVLGVVVVVTALAVLRARTRQRLGAPDPFTLSEPWRQHVSASLSAQRRYDSLIAGVTAGPLRTTLDRISVQVHTAVSECWVIAQRGDQLDDTIRTLDGQSLRARLSRATDDEMRRSLEQQLAALDKVRSTRTDTDRRLHGLQTRLGQLVSESAVIVANADQPAGGPLESDVDDLVVQLRTLHLAVNEVLAINESPEAGGSAPPSA